MTSSNENRRGEKTFYFFIFFSIVAWSIGLSQQSNFVDNLADSWRINGVKMFVNPDFRIKALTGNGVCANGTTQGCWRYTITSKRDCRKVVGKHSNIGAARDSNLGDIARFKLDVSAGVPFTLEFPATRGSVTGELMTLDCKT